jgi:Protein of unknown function (DUF1566)
MRVLALVSMLTAVASAHAGGVPPGMPDTGQDTCYNGAALVACTSGNSGVGATFPGQDGRFGRDAKATSGTLVKQGGGAAGFDYTKVANNGSDVPAGTALGTGATDWACTRDNVTGLLWEVKVNDNTQLRHYDWVYTWYSTDAATNGGDPGTPSSSNPGAVCETAGRCDTQTFTADVNASALCGFTDWRMPALRELQTIVHHGVINPSIDTTYFPNTGNSVTQSFDFWTATTEAGGTYAAWFLYFGQPSTDGAATSAKSGGSHIRLVRGVPF